LIRRNKPAAVILSEDEFAELVSDAERTRIAESLADIREGRVHWGSAADLIAELHR